MHEHGWIDVSIIHQISTGYNVDKYELYITTIMLCIVMLFPSASSEV